MRKESDQNEGFTSVIFLVFPLQSSLCFLCTVSLGRLVFTFHSQYILGSWLRPTFYLEKEGVEATGLDHKKWRWTCSLSLALPMQSAVPFIWLPRRYEKKRNLCHLKSWGNNLWKICIAFSWLYLFVYVWNGSQG
jgi:hypothetical protein